MPVRSLRSRDAQIFIPPAIYVPYVKVTITTSGGTVYEVADSTSNSDVDNQISKLSFTPTNTNRMGNFDLELNNNNAKFLNKFSEGDIVQIYMDYINGTTLKFRGKVDNVFYKMDNSFGFSCEIEGRQFPELVDDITIIDFTTADIVDCFKGTTGNIDDLGNYENGLLYETEIRWSPDNTLEVGDITTTISQSYQNKSRMKIMSEICNTIGCDFYIYYSAPDSEWHIRVFERNSISNTVEYIAQGINLQAVPRVGTDNTERKNKIIVYGKEENNLPLIKTDKDSTDIANSWTKSEIVSNSNYITMESITELAAKELAEKSASSFTANLTTYGVLNIRPGEKITCSVPYCGINGQYKIDSFKITMNSSGDLSTEVTIQKWNKNVADLFKEAFDIEGAIKSYSNLYNMSDSFKFFFDSNDDDSWYALSNCETADGVLRLSSGQSSGTLTSAITSTFIYGESATNITHADLRVYANQYAACTYELSNNDGITWETVTPGIVNEFGSIGSSLRVRITLAEATAGISPEFDAIAVLYK